MKKTTFRSSQENFDNISHARFLFFATFFQQQSQLNPAQIFLDLIFVYHKSQTLNVAASLESQKF